MTNDRRPPRASVAETRTKAARLNHGDDCGAGVGTAMSDPLTRLPGVGFKHASDFTAIFEDGTTLTAIFGQGPPDEPKPFISVGLGRFWLKHDRDPKWYRADGGTSRFKLTAACKDATTAQQAWAKLAEREYPDPGTPCADCAWACNDIGEAWCEMGNRSCPLGVGVACASRQTRDELGAELERLDAKREDEGSPF